jgi:hypothetical protein
LKPELNTDKACRLEDTLKFCQERAYKQRYLDENVAASVVGIGGLVMMIGKKPEDGSFGMDGTEVKDVSVEMIGKEVEDESVEDERYSTPSLILPVVGSNGNHRRHGTSSVPRQSRGSSAFP